MVVFCLRTLLDDARWRRLEPLVRTGFWGLNGGLALMVVLDLFPGGVLQLWDVFQHGYWHARRLPFLMTGTFHALEWARIVADTVFLVLGVVPIVVATLRGVAGQVAQG
jgi:nitric oxide reductase subunit B